MRAFIAGLSLAFLVLFTLPICLLLIGFAIAVSPMGALFVLCFVFIGIAWLRSEDNNVDSSN